MSISTFGGISSNVNSDSNIIGELINVPFNFAQTGYVDAGSTFSSTQYPALAAVTPPQFNADLWVSHAVPTNIPARATQAPGTAGNPNSTVGLPIQTITYNGEFFVFFSTGVVFRTTGGNISSLGYLTTIAVPAGSTVVQVMVANTNIYVSFSGSAQLNVYSEYTLTTVAYTTINSSSTGAWNVVYGNSVYFAYKWGTLGTSLYKSTDGVTWSSTTFGITGTIAGIDWNGSEWLLATTATSGSNHASSPDGINWTAVASGITIVAGLLRWNAALSMFVIMPSASGAAIYTSPSGAASSWTAQRAMSAAMTWLDISSTGVMTVSATPTNAAMWSYVSTNGTTWNVSTASTVATVIQCTSTTAPTYGAVTSYPFIRAFGSTNVVIGLQGNYGGTYSTAGQLSLCTSTNSFSTISTPVPLFSTSGSVAVYPPVFLSNGTTGLLMEFDAPGNKPTWTAGISTSGGVVPSEVVSSAFQGPYYAITTNGGSTWGTPAQIPVPTNNTSPITWKGGYVTPTHFLVFGLLSTTSTVFVASSPDGVNWTINNAPSSITTLTPTVVGENIYMGANVSSNYGATWNPLSTSTSSYPYYMGTNFVSAIASGSGTFISASNLANGSVATTSVVPTFTSLSATNTPWCTGPKGSIVTMYSTAAAPYTTTSYLFSPDNGATWNLRTFPLAINPTAAFYCNGYFIIFYSPTAYLYGTDGNTWLQGSMPGTAAFQNYWAKQGSSYNSAPWLAGGYGTFVGPDTTTYRVPYTAPFTTGSKWTVKAQ